MSVRGKIYWGRLGAGCIAALFGLLGTGAGIAAIMDPVGSQMADDSHPFDPPPPLVQTLTITHIYFFLLVLGIWLIIRSEKKPQA